jgi:proteasome lid subunit RPN8/RPN11
VANDAGKGAGREDGKPADSGGAGGAADAVVTGGWSGKAKVTRRRFPGAGGSDEPLRVAMTRDAYAELTAHAKESLNAEVCGVLVGTQCEDDDGPFVSVEGAIRGSAARKGRTHVTFTQETWTQIYEDKERDYPKLQIVGWYHTHPGFGVEFSEMDRFVQRNFFPGAGQIAFVTDPLGGAEAILANVDGDVVPVGRFWVDGRERRCQTPAGAEQPSSATSAAVPASVEKSLRAMDERIGQLMQLVDSQAASLHRFLLISGMIIALGVCAVFGYTIYSSYAHENRPPELQGFVPVPVQIGDKSVLLGVGIVKWQVPDELNAAFLQLERERQAAEKANAAATQPATRPAGAAAPTTQPAGKPAK